MSIGIAIGLATLGLALGHVMTERWSWVAGILAIGLLWLAEPWHGARWVPTMALLLFTAAAIVGVFLDLPEVWLLTSLVAALIAWDLGHFTNYLSDVQEVLDERDLTIKHLRRLGIVAGVGWLLGIVALNVQLTFDFVLTLGLALLGIIVLGRALRHVRRENEQDQY